MTSHSEVHKQNKCGEEWIQKLSTQNLIISQRRAVSFVPLVGNLQKTLHLSLHFLFLRHSPQNKVLHIKNESVKCNNWIHIFTLFGCRLTQWSRSLWICREHRLERIGCCVPVSFGLSLVWIGDRWREWGALQLSVVNREALLGQDQRSQSTKAAAQPRRQ